MDVWINRAIALLDKSLNPIAQELNELDWKEDLSPNNQKLSKHLSAFSNLPGGGFLVFGIGDKTGEVKAITTENAELIVQKLSSLARDTLSPEVAIDHRIEQYLDKPILFIHIKESATKPVHLRSGTIEDSFIRSGGTTQKASRQEIGGLMLNSKNPVFEDLHVSKLLPGNEILSLLDYRKILELLGKPNHHKDDAILHWLEQENMIKAVDDTGYYITNLGALAAANSLKDFDSLARKAVRVIKYKGNNKIVTEREYPGNKGYAISFEALLLFIKTLLPSSEIIKTALRAEASIYPDIALRELIANALIHQDFTVKGAGPMIEIYDNRIEISNPGKLLPSKSVDRLIGTTPQSRNDALASAFRRYNICEERGSGFQKSVAAIELYGLPPLRFEEMANSFRVTIYAPRSFAELSPLERVEAAYQHSVLQYFSSSTMTNTSLRERFKMHDKQRSQVSLVIKEALNQKRIKAKDPNNASTKFVEYIPFWV
ncbi:MAG TPA: ATP-binding protein [Flavobacterium sp.]|nr:ATP-binding protein [Flavobacterium sp.]